ncbi:MAG: AI-2E family transporter [Clostridiales bacterium]|jgi:predicted PurR-regulated permease PerM|nr:AI-2E family transporter [Clostridiales bacterium]
MNKTINSRTFKFFLPYFLLALAIILAFRITGEMEFFVGILRRIWGIISPFFAGFILAYIVNIPISGIQGLLVRVSSKTVTIPPSPLGKTGNNFALRRHKILSAFAVIANAVNKFVLKRQKMLSVIAVVLITAGIIALALNFIVPAIAGSIAVFVYNLDDYWAGILRVVQNFNEMEFFGLHIDTDLVFSILGEMFTNISLENILQPLSALMGVGNAIFAGAIAFISSIYVLVEKDRFKVYARKLLKIFTSETVQTIVTVNLSRLNNNFRQYVRTQTIDGLILGTMATIALWLMGSPFAVILGIMLGILNYIPYFGSIFGTIIAVLVVILTQSFTMGLIAAAVLFVIQQIDANIIQPRLMSGSFSLSPLLVIISITFGGALAGILGMLVAIPVVAVLKEIFDSIVEYYERKKFGEPPKPEEDNV